MRVRNRAPPIITRPTNYTVPSGYTKGTGTKMVVVNMQSVGKNVDPGTYPVVFTKAMEKKIAQKGDLVMLLATIKDSGTEFDGRSLMCSHLIKGNAEEDDTTLFYLQKNLLAFGAEEDDVTDEKFNPVTFANENLVGAKALAEVVWNHDKTDAEKIYVNTTFKPSDL